MFGIVGGLKSFDIYRSSLRLFLSGNSLFYMVGPFKLFEGNGGKPIFIIYEELDKLGTGCWFISPESAGGYRIYGGKGWIKFYVVIITHS